jgi:hypothetical protein
LEQYIAPSIFLSPLGLPIFLSIDTFKIPLNDQQIKLDRLGK